MKKSGNFLLNNFWLMKDKMVLEIIIKNGRNSDFEL